MKFPTVDYSGLKTEYRLSNDGDTFGTAMQWLFAACAVLYERDDCNGAILKEMRYRPGAAGNHVETSDECCEMWAIKRADTPTLERFVRVLSRQVDMCEATGRSY